MTSIISSNGASGALLKIQQQAERIGQMYEDDPRTETFNAIIYGPPKVGKTTLLHTCPAPIFVHSFDPGGSKVIDADIKNGRALVDTQFEVDDPMKPRAFAKWEAEMASLEKSGFFNHVGTFVVDSMTTWGQCIMYDVIRTAAVKSTKRKVGTHPHQQDWMPQMSIIEKWMRKFVSLPCNCILLGHEDIPTDEDGNQIGDKTMMTTGKLKQRIPALFDEVYYMHLESAVKGTRKLQTQPRNRISAGSRIGHGGVFELNEEPDIKAMLKKAGYPYEDKTLFKDLSTTEDEVSS